MVVIYFNKSALRNVWKTLESGVFLPNKERGGEVENELVAECAVYTRKQSIINTMLGVGTFICTVSGTVFLPKNEDTWKLPFGRVPEFDFPHYYEIIYMFQLVVYLAMGIVFTLADAIYMCILAHISVQCKLLQNCIRRIVENASNSRAKENNLVEPEYKIDSSKVPNVYLNHQLRQVVIHHEAIINVATNTEKIFNSVILTEFAGFSIVGCFLMYQAALNPLLNVNALKSFSMLLSILIILGVISFWGNEVMVESEAISSACYDVDFVGTDIAFQKALMVVMRRSQRPIAFTVGKFAPVCFVTMLALCRASYSYFTVLVNAQENKK